MTPKRITVKDDSGNASNESVANDAEFKSLIEDYSIRCLMTDDPSKTKIRGFESLENGGTYTLGPRIQQQNSERLDADDDQKQTLERIERKLDDMATVAKGMSEATEDFTRELLAAKGIMFRTLPVCTEVVDAAFSDRIYQWGEKEGESDGQRGCKLILEGELLPLSLDGRALGIFDVRALPLPEVREGKQKSNGFADLAIGDAESLNLPHTRDLTFGLSAGLIELKTGRAFLEQGQLLLQLVALSMISNARQGVVVLGTDCAEKWRLVYFSKFNEITIQQYKCGKKCLQDLTSLIQASIEKAHSLVPSPLPSIPKTEFPRDGEHSANTPSYLEAVAHRLAGLFPSEREALAPLMDNNHNPPSMIYL